MALSPQNDDVVAHIRRDESSVVYLLGTAATPDQFVVGTRDEALSKAIAYARRQRVRAWLAGDDGFVLLGTFRKNDRSTPPMATVGPDVRPQQMKKAG